MRPSEEAGAYPPAHTWMRRWVVSASHPHAPRTQPSQGPAPAPPPCSHSSRWRPSFTETDAQGSGTALGQWASLCPRCCRACRLKDGQWPVSCAAAACGHSRFRPPASGLSPRLPLPTQPSLRPRCVPRWLPPSQAWHNQRPASLRSGLPASLEADPPLFGVLVDSAGSRSAFMHIN